MPLTSPSELVYDGATYRSLSAIARRDHCRAAKKRAREIQFTRGLSNRVRRYRELIAIARTTLAYLDQATERLAVATSLPYRTVAD